MDHPDAITNDALAEICTTRRVRVPARKAERVQEITEAFADPDRARAIRGDLSSTAAEMRAGTLRALVVSKVANFSITDAVNLTAGGQGHPLWCHISVGPVSRNAVPARLAGTHTTEIQST